MLLHVKVKPNQRFDRVEKIGSDWQIRIRASPVDGKANEHLVVYLSEVLNLSKSKIILIKGLTSRMKTLEIHGPDEVILEKLEKASRKIGSSGNMP